MSTSRGNPPSSGDGKAKLPPDRVSLRIDLPLRERLQYEMEVTGMELSQVLRTALQVGLEKVEDVPEALRRATFKEGIVAGIAEYRRAVTAGSREITQAALNGVDGALAGWKK